MREFFVAFRSRSEAMKFYEAVTSYRLPSKLINTPSAAGVGCGLSVKMFAKDMPRVNVILNRGRFPSFAGAFYILSDGTVAPVSAIGKM